MVPSPHKASKQHKATTQWLNKPSVLEAPWEKVHLHVAWQTRNCERKKTESLTEVSSRSIGAIEHMLDQCNLGPVPTLLELWLSVDEWKSDWGPESVWLKKFDESLHKAWEKGLFASTMHSMQWGHQLDTYLQIFDLLEVVLSEAKFFEIKLDKYAPAVPYSQVSNARYYSGINQTVAPIAKCNSKPFTIMQEITPPLTISALGQDKEVGKSGTRGTGHVQCTLSEKMCAWVWHTFNLIGIVAHLKWIFLETLRTLAAASFLHSVHGALVGTATELAVWRVFLLAGTQDFLVHVQSFITVAFTVSVPEEVVIVVVVSSVIVSVSTVSTVWDDPPAAHKTNQKPVACMPTGTSCTWMNKKAKLSTSRVHHVIVSCKFSRGVAQTVNEILGPKRLETRATEAKECQRALFEALHKGHKNFFQPEMDNVYNVTSILDGSKSIDFSHGGGELRDLARDLFNDMKNIEDGGWQKHHMDYRTHCDHAQCRIDIFAREMPELVWAYLEWSVNSADSNEDQVQLYMLGIFCTEKCALQMHLVVNDLVLKALRHDTLDWRLRNSCPACMYTLKDEPDLKFKLLFAMDGNNSLKCISRAAIGSYKSTARGIGEQFVGNDHYLSWSFIDQFGVGGSDESLTGPMPLYLQADNNNPCTGRWKNMKEDVTSRMWAIFDEAGIFMAICRHGFSLVIVDIVQSGEQAKYPLAVVSKLLDMFGDNLAGSYDIGSRYVDGLGLEDLEGCECTFSKTNGLALAVHYARYIAHNDEYEVYQNLICSHTPATMILNNYKQAIHIVQEGKSTLLCLMDEIGITNASVFSVWLLEEKEYLAAHSHEPKEETLQMEYWKKLMNLDTSQEVGSQCGKHGSHYPRKHLNDLTWTMATPSSTSTLSFVQRDIAAMTRKETIHHHAMENFEKDLKMAQDLKIKLGITKHWVPEDEEWQTTGCLVTNHKYQCCLNQLESLIVTQIFELSKMNQAGTGYKLSAHACSPLHHQLTFEEVVEYMFLTDFDLLHHATCEDISQHPWASPATQVAMDQYFRVCCAEEEIKCLNVEVHCTTVVGKSTKMEPRDSAGEPAVKSLRECGRRTEESPVGRWGLSSTQEGLSCLAEGQRVKKRTENVP
ncbi:hypothetical protein EDD17DRAFT_1513586 [Pisolithus thermaeus]|nr:hypothetical protein EDD17DRAFT_1513586 [Pisolithus thermaeus]